MTTFLGTSDFQGVSAHPTRSVDFGGEAIYLGALVFHNVARPLVEALLPHGYRLAPRTTGHDPDVHPMILMFGDQTDGRILPSEAPTGLHYSELIVAVPFVQRKWSDVWHNLIVRMYLDNDAAVELGKAYGYAKKKAWLDWRGDGARATHGGADVWTGTIEWGTPWMDFETALTDIPNFADMVEIMSTRMLGVFGVFWPLCSHWEWDFTAARIATANVSFDMLLPFTFAMSSWPALSPFENVTGGAVILRGLRWRIQGPAGKAC